MRIASKAALLRCSRCSRRPEVAPRPAATPQSSRTWPGTSATAPDLTSLKVDYKGDDALMVEAGLAGGGTLAANSHIVVGFDTDHDASTAGDGGAEYLLVESRGRYRRQDVGDARLLQVERHRLSAGLALRSGLSAGARETVSRSRCSASATSVSRRRSRSSLAPSSTDSDDTDLLPDVGSTASRCPSSTRCSTSCRGNPPRGGSAAR